MPLGSRSVSIFIVLMLVISLLVNAQDKRQRSIAATETTDSTKQDPKRGSVSTPASVKLVEPPGADFISGEANVAVSGNRNPIIRLGLSPNGATIIEFPSADRLFNIIPGNSNLVTVEESPTKNTDHFIIARPGDGFASPTTMAQARRAPVTSVIVQMQSGLVITFLFYPVQQLAEQAHRVVITYDRNEVEAARRAAGLAVNLDSTAGATKPRTTSLRITTPSDSTVPDEKTSTHATAPRPPTAVADLAEIDTSEPPARRLGKSSDPVRAAGLALTEATRTPGSFKKWSETVHGLSLSVSPVREVNKHSQLVVIAVKNTKKRAARIVPGQPGIYLETFDSKKRPIQIEAIRKIAVETTVEDEVLPPGKTEYYAVVYETPVMGVRQRLRASVGQIYAADEPATANLTSSNR
jgi:hypothetical protein